METLTCRDICERLYDKMALFVAPAFDQAPNEFRNLYRNRVKDFPGGFRRVDLVPKPLLVKRIAKDSALDPEVALAIMSNWYRSKAELHERATRQLQSLGYEVHEPDFENDAITHQTLNAQHIKAENEAYFFSSGEEAGSVDKLDLTVMVALLGWFPEPPQD